jgi:GNAT superfamily N-acetyltransferase
MADGTAPAGYEISTEFERIDREVIWQYLSTEAYWGRSRTRELVEAQIDRAWRVVGAYESGSGAMVGFARVLSDGIGLAYLADVFVLPAHQGRGVATAMLEELIERGPGAHLRWTLFTSDAHSLYRKFGFAEPDATAMVRPAR